MVVSAKVFLHELFIALIAACLVIGGFSIFYESHRNEQLYKNQIEACELTNEVRAATAVAVTAQKAVNEALASFVQSSIAFRLSQGQTELAAQSTAAVRLIRGANERLIVPLPIDCFATVDKP